MRVNIIGSQVTLDGVTRQEIDVLAVALASAVNGVPPIWMPEDCGDACRMREQIEEALEELPHEPDSPVEPDPTGGTGGH